ncbi:MAG: glycosyltransferase [Pirellulales bacterium]
MVAKSKTPFARPVRVLVVGQTPPPYHGQAMMIQMFVDGPHQDIEVRHIRMAFSRTMDEVGRPGLSKVFHLIALILRIWWSKIRYRPHVLYYPPAGPNRIPLLRDAIILIAVRPLFRKTVFHFHASGASEIITTMPKWMKWFIVRALRHPTAAIRLSQYTIDDSSFIAARRSVIIPNACEDHWPRLEQQCIEYRGSSNRPIQILIIGTVCETKGILDLLDACRRLKEKQLSFHLHVVGSFQPADFEQQVRDTITAYELQGHTTVHGQLTGDAKWNMLAQTDIFCFPTYYESEGLPVVLIEAQSLGLPIVSTRWRGVPSIVDDSENGFLVEIRDSAALAEQLAKLAADPELRSRFGESARRKYWTTFTPAAYLRAMDSLIVDVARS